MSRTWGVDARRCCSRFVSPRRLKLGQPYFSWCGSPRESHLGKLPPKSNRHGPNWVQNGELGRCRKSAHQIQSTSHMNEIWETSGPSRLIFGRHWPIWADFGNIWVGYDQFRPNLCQLWPEPEPPAPTSGPNSDRPLLRTWGRSPTTPRSTSCGRPTEPTPILQIARPNLAAVLAIRTDAPPWCVYDSPSPIERSGSQTYAHSIRRVLQPLWCASETFLVGQVQACRGLLHECPQSRPVSSFIIRLT